MSGRYLHDITALYARKGETTCEHLPVILTWAGDIVRQVPTS
jgi:hypothetical protein